MRPILPPSIPIRSNDFTDKTPGNGRPEHSEPDHLLTEFEAAAYLGVSPKSLRNWRWRGDGPTFVKLGGRKLVRYRRSDLSAFVEDGVRHSTSERS